MSLKILVKCSRFLLTFVFLTVWIFSGWLKILGLPFRIEQAQAATISFVGSCSNNGNNGSNATLTLPVGTAENDLVIVAYGNADADNSDLNMVMVTSGYNEVADLFSNDTFDANMGVYWKVMGSTPDTQAVADNIGGADTDTPAVCMVFRGVDTTTPMDVTPTTSTGLSTYVANPPSINHNNPSGVWTVIAGANAHNLGGSQTFTFPTGYTTDAIQIAGDDTTDGTVGMGYRSSGVSDPEDPGTMTHSGTDSTSFAWGAVTMALRPSVDPTYEQSAYRFFDNSDSTDVGTALAAQDTSATLGATGAAFRLRTLLHVEVAQLASSGQNFKLQFATKSGTCDTGFSGETYADVTGATAIAYSTANSAADGDNLTSNANDPTHSGHTIANQDYEEANNFTNTVAAIPTGQDGKWDFSLIDNGAPSNTSYCFRIRKSDDSDLDTYTVIPEITTAPAVPMISSAANQTFTVGDSATAISTITITDGSTPEITTTDDIRIQIPSSFDMTWDTSDTTATIGGGASAKVNSTVSYPDSKTLLIEVTTGFSSLDTITVSGLSFTNFTGASASDNLDLLIAGSGGAVEDTDDKTILINQFEKVQEDTTVSDTTVTSIAATFGAGATAGNLIVTALAVDKNSGTITVPSGFTLIQDYVATSVSSALAYKIATGGETSVSWSYVTTHTASVWAAEYAGLVDTSVLDVSVENNAGETSVQSLSTGTTGTTAQDIELAFAILAIDSSDSMNTDRSWTNSFTEQVNVGSNSATPGLSVATKELTTAGTVETTWSTTDTGDQAYVALATFKAPSVSADPTISSAANQAFAVGNLTTGVSTITVTDGSTPVITSTNDIRIKIPSAFNMVWDEGDTTATIGGGASGKVSSTVSYPDSKTLLIDVTTNFSASDVITISGLSFENFSAASSADNLELVVAGSGGATADEDSKTIQVIAPTLSSSANQTFAVSDPTTFMATTTVTDGTTGVIKAANDIRIKIPSAFNMVWDTDDTTPYITYIDLDDYQNQYNTNDLPVATADVSSITYNELTGTLFMTTNGTPTIYEYNVNGEHQRTITMSGFVDTEAIDWMYGTTYAVTEEASPYDIIIITIDSGTTSVTKSGGTVIDPSVTVSTNLGLEGIAYDTANDWFYTVYEKQANGSNGGRVYKIEMDATATELSTLNTNLINAGYTDLSDLHYDDDTGHLFLLSHESSIIVEALTDGTIIDTMDVDTGIFGQAEGLDISADGQYMFISGEPDDYQRLVRSDKVATSTVSYEDSGKTLVISINADFGDDDYIIISGLSFENFSGGSSADNLELVVGGSSASVSDLDDKTIEITGGTSGTLTFSISDNSIGFGTLTSADDFFANGAGTGSATEVEAHTLTASTNASGGYVITVNGTTLTSGSNTISAIGASNTASSVGTEQFGLRMSASGGNGSVTAPYAASGFAFDTGSFPDQVASDADGDDVTTTYSVRYLGNIGATTEAGSYSATLTYIITAGF